jgi:hypothetical protein
MLGVGVGLLVEALAVEVVYLVAGEEDVLFGDGEFPAYPLAEFQGALRLKRRL